jgi:hypothetical protein
MFIRWNQDLTLGAAGMRRTGFQNTVLRRWNMITRYFRSVFAGLALAVLMGLSLLASLTATASAQVFRWDIITFNAQGQPAPGGRAVALADNVDGNIASMTLTGSGTFDISNDSDVTGGGTFIVRNFPNGTIQASGTYRATRLVLFRPTSAIPGTNLLGGLAVLSIHYSDGAEGIIVVNCTINAPPQETEGVTTTKGTVDFWSIQGGHTVFHTGTAF